MSTTNLNKILLDAIDDYEQYTHSTREVLKILVSLATDDVANVTVSYLTKAVGLKKIMIYLILKKLEKDQFIERTHQPGTRHDYFKINRDHIQKIIVTSYQKKQTFL